MLLVSPRWDMGKRGIHTVEFILINDDRLKITLSKSDLEEFNLTADALDYSNVETKRMFWDILGRAKQSTGFSCDGERVLVRLYASRDGGCEMFISKLEDTDDCDILCSEDPDLCNQKNGRDFKKRTGAYRFDKLQWLLEVCRRLSEMGYSGESSAFYDSNGIYYLFLYGLDGTGYFKFDEFSFIDEYGNAENPEITYDFLGEHGRAICIKNAVEALSTL